MSMADSGTDTIPVRFEVKATASDHFSWLRTRLSIERTMMSWVRTATALIGFGFTIEALEKRLRVAGCIYTTMRSQVALGG
jgi:putative membrane protein